MIETIYPENIRAQLNILDEMIAKVYEDELSTETGVTDIKNIEEERRIKKALYEKIRPLVNEKVRLIQNSCPAYIIHM